MVIANGVAAELTWKLISELIFQMNRKHTTLFPMGSTEDTSRDNFLDAVTAYFEYIENRNHSLDQIGHDLGFKINKSKTNISDIIASLSISGISKGALMSYLKDYKDNFHEVEDPSNTTYADDKIFNGFVEAIKEDLKIYFLGLSYESIYTYFTKKVGRNIDSELQKLFLINTAENENIRRFLTDYLSNIDESKYITDKTVDYFIKNVAEPLPKVTSFLFFDSLYKNMLRFQNCKSKRDFTFKLSEYNKLGAIDIKQVPSEGTKNRKLLDKEIHDLRVSTELIDKSDTYEIGLHKALTMSRYNNKTHLFDILFLSFLSHEKQYKPIIENRLFKINRLQHNATKMFLLSTWEMRKFNNPVSDIYFLDECLFPALIKYIFHIIEEKCSGTKQILLYKKIFVDLFEAPCQLHTQKLEEINSFVNKVSKNFYKDYVYIRQQIYQMDYLKKRRKRED